MKRFISSILIMLLIVAPNIVISFGVNNDNQNEEIVYVEYIQNNDYIIYEGGLQGSGFDCIMTSQGTYKYSYDLETFYGDQILIRYANGEEKYYTNYYDWDYDSSSEICVFRWCSDTIKCDFSDNQSKTPWSIGANYINVSVGGIKSKTPIVINILSESATSEEYNSLCEHRYYGEIQSLTYIQNREYTEIAGEPAWAYKKDNGDFEYEFEIDNLWGDQIRVKYKNGKERIFTCYLVSDPSLTFNCGNTNEYIDVIFDKVTVSDPLSVGTHYFPMRTYYYDSQQDRDVRSNDLKLSLKVLPNPDYLMKNVSVNMDTIFTYSGKDITPKPILKHDGKTLILNKDYTVSYQNNCKSPGVYKATIKGKGKYSGTVTKTYQIKQGTLKLGKPSIKKIGKKTQIYTKPSGNYEASYYQFRIAKNKACTKFLVKPQKTKLVKGKIAVFGKLSKKKTYYMQVRAVKTVGKTNYYTAWSKPIKFKGKN